MKNKFFILAISFSQITPSGNQFNAPKPIEDIKIDFENHQQRITWQRAILTMLVAADVGTELHNATYESASIFSNLNAGKLAILATFANGRDVTLWDVILYSGIVSAQALINYNSKKGSLIAARNKIIEWHEEEKQKKLAQELNTDLRQKVEKID